jgi:hypothetical protein
VTLALQADRRNSIGVREGGEKIAKYEVIAIVHLDEDSTGTDYVLRFLDRVFAGASAELRATTTTIIAMIEVSKSGEAGPSQA